jgi:hypothetical protein
VKPEELQAQIAARRAAIARLSKALHKQTCDGVPYSLEEDVEVMQKIERLEDEIAALGRELRSRRGR